MCQVLCLYVREKRERGGGGIEKERKDGREA